LEIVLPMHLNYPLEHDILVRRMKPMLKAAAFLAVGIGLVLGQLGNAQAISIISQGTGTDVNESCSGPVGCPTVVPVVGLPTPAWQANNPFGAGTGVWVSYNAGTGSGGVTASPNSTITPFAVFSEILPSGPGTLSLSVWADDTAEVSIAGTGGGVKLSPNFSTDGTCADGPLGCEPGEQGSFVAILGAGDHILNISVFQVGGYSFGTLWSGEFTPDELTPVPEPASILLLGSALAAAGVASRRRWSNRK
jgi:hypothetical protein